MNYRGVRTFIDNFDRAQALTTTPGMNGWTIKKTGSGTPTYLTITENEGAMKLLLDNTSEAQIVTMYQNDVLIYDFRHLKSLWWVAKVGAVDAVTTLVMGLGTAENDTTASVTNSAWFRISGATSTANLITESTDGTNVNTAIATGTTLASVYKKMVLDFTYGIQDVRFFCDGVRVSAGTTFNMSALAADQNFQPYVQLGKASGTGVPFVTIAQFGIQYEWEYGQ